jgi:hypothetical protein
MKHQKLSVSNLITNLSVHRAWFKQNISEKDVENLKLPDDVKDVDTYKKKYSLNSEQCRTLEDCIYNYNVDVRLVLLLDKLIKLSDSKVELIEVSTNDNIVDIKSIWKNRDEILKVIELEMTKINTSYDYANLMYGEIYKAFRRTTLPVLFTAFCHHNQEYIKQKLPQTRNTSLPEELQGLSKAAQEALGGMEIEATEDNANKVLGLFHDLVCQPFFLSDVGPDFLHAPISTFLSRKLANSTELPGTLGAFMSQIRSIHKDIQSRHKIEIDVKEVKSDLDFYIQDDYSFESGQLLNKNLEYLVCYNASFGFPLDYRLESFKLGSIGEVLTPEGYLGKFKENSVDRQVIDQAQAYYSSLEKSSFTKEQSLKLACLFHQDTYVPFKTWHTSLQKAINNKIEGNMSLRLDKPVPISGVPIDSCFEGINFYYFVQLGAAIEGIVDSMIEKQKQNTTIKEEESLNDSSSFGNISINSKRKGQLQNENSQQEEEKEIDLNDPGFRQAFQSKIEGAAMVSGFCNSNPKPLVRSKINFNEIKNDDDEIISTKLGIQLGEYNARLTDGVNDLTKVDVAYKDKTVTLELERTDSVWQKASYKATITGIKEIIR